MVITAKHVEDALKARANAEAEAAAKGQELPYFVGYKIAFLRLIDHAQPDNQNTACGIAETGTFEEAFRYLVIVSRLGHLLPKAFSQETAQRVAVPLIPRWLQAIPGKPRQIRFPYGKALAFTTEKGVWVSRRELCMGLGKGGSYLSRLNLTGEAAARLYENGYKNNLRKISSLKRQPIVCVSLADAKVAAMVFSAPDQQSQAA